MCSVPRSVACSVLCSVLCLVRRLGTPNNNKTAIAKGKNRKKGLTKGGTRYAVAILDGKVIVCRPCSHYVRFGGPPPPRAPQPRTKNGKLLGRKRKPENEKTTEKKGSFCSRPTTPKPPRAERSSSLVLSWLALAPFLVDLWVAAVSPGLRSLVLAFCRPLCSRPCAVRVQLGSSSPC